MNTIGLFFGSTTGKTEEAADEIVSNFSKVVTLHNVADCSGGDVLAYSHLILGVPTWGEGELQDDWEEFIDDLKDQDLTGKTVALFGLGDAGGYPDSFVDGLGILYEVVVKGGGKVVGSWPAEGYIFDESAALKDGQFVGLVLDYDNEEGLSSARIAEWVRVILRGFNE